MSHTRQYFKLFPFLLQQDAVDRDQRSNLVRHVPLRFHSRHASIGTLPVFHPRTGLPVSSSPVSLVFNPANYPSDLIDKIMKKQQPELICFITKFFYCLK